MGAVLRAPASGPLIRPLFAETLLRGRGSMWRELRAPAPPEGEKGSLDGSSGEGGSWPKGLRAPVPPGSPDVFGV